MFVAASQDFLFSQSCSLFLHFLYFFSFFFLPPSHSPSLGLFKDVSWGPGQSQILSKFSQLFQTLYFPLGSPSLPSLTFFPPAVVLAFAYQTPKPQVIPLISLLLGSPHPITP